MTMEKQMLGVPVNDAATAGANVTVVSVVGKAAAAVACTRPMSVHGPAVPAVL